MANENECKVYSPWLGIIIILEYFFDCSNRYFKNFLCKVIYVHNISLPVLQHKLQETLWTIKLRHTFDLVFMVLLKKGNSVDITKITCIFKHWQLNGFRYRFGVEVEGGASMFVVLVWVGVVRQVRVGGVMSVGGIVGGMRMVSCSLKKKNKLWNWFMIHTT